MNNGLNNRAAVWNFFRDNPCHSQLDCAAALGLNRRTVSKHAAAIRDGWRPAVDAPPSIIALQLIIRAISYPVCTSIKARGYDLRGGSNDLIEFVNDVARAAIDG